MLFSAKILGKFERWPQHFLQTYVFYGQKQGTSWSKYEGQRHY